MKIVKIVKILGMLGLFLCVGGIKAQEMPTLTDTVPHNRPVFLEEFTGIGCQFCPLGHKAGNDLAKKYPGQVFLMLVHQGSFSTPKPGELDLRTPYGDALYNQIGGDGYPAGDLNRHILEGNKLDVYFEDWDKHAPTILKMPSYANLGAKATMDWKSREVKFEVELYYTGEPSVSSNYLSIAVLQDDIMGTQVGMKENPTQVVDGKYIHMHALRDMVNGQWGEAITEISKGKLIRKTYTYTLPESVKNVPLDINNVNFLVFVAEGHKEILTACHAEITHVNAPEFNVQFIKAEQVENISCDDLALVSLTLKNKSASKLENMTIEAIAGDKKTEINLDASSFTSSSTKTFTTKPFAIPLNVRGKVSFTITKVNGVAYTYDVKKSIDCEVSKWGEFLSSGDKAQLNLVQDRWGSEITWDFKLGNTEIAKGGPYKDLEEIGTQLRTAELAVATPGCYMLRVKDVNKDGIHSSFGNGYIEIKDASNRVFAKHDGIYGASAWIFVGKSHVGGEENRVLTSDFSIQPNPASGISVNLLFNLLSAENIQIHICDFTGRAVMQTLSHAGIEGRNTVSLPVSGLKSGLYLVSLQNKDGKQSVQKLVIK